MPAGSWLVSMPNSLLPAVAYSLLMATVFPLRSSSVTVAVSSVLVLYCRVAWLRVGLGYRERVGAGEDSIAILQAGTLAVKV